MREGEEGVLHSITRHRIKSFNHHIENSEIRCSKIVVCWDISDKRDVQVIDGLVTEGGVHVLVANAGSLHRLIIVGVVFNVRGGSVMNILIGVHGRDANDREGVDVLEAVVYGCGFLLYVQTELRLGGV